MRQRKGEGKGKRSVSIGGNVTGSVIQTGDRNVASTRFERVTLPQPDSVDIKEELAALREILAQLQSADQNKVERAVQDAEDELAKPDPDPDEVGRALDRAINYAQKAEGFASAVAKLRPHMMSVVAWLGQSWHKLLSLVGLIV